MIFKSTRSRVLPPLAQSLFSVFVVALLVCGSPLTTLAQTDYGTLVIYVREPAGPGEPDKPSPGKTVAVSGEQGARRTCVTKEDGVCTFGALKPGLYTVEVGGNKLGPYRVSDGQVVTRRLDSSALLTAARVTPPIAGPPIFTGSLQERLKQDRLGVASTAAEVETLSNRNQAATPLIELLPGAFENQGQFVINGSSQNVVRVGGVDTTPQELSSASFQDTGAALSGVKDRQSINSYASFSVDTSNTPAKFGTGTGGQLLANINQGGNTFAGKVYEYFANDALSARNFFDFARKPSLRFNLFGLNLGRRLSPWSGDAEGKRSLYAFFNYEGIRASSGSSIFEAAPSAAVRGRAAPAVAPLLDAYRAGGATVVAGASSDPDFDILKLDTKNFAGKDGVTARLDYNLNKMDALNFIYLGAISTEDVPAGVTGRRSVSRNASHTGILNYTRALTKKDAENAKLTNQFIFAVKTDPVRLSSRIPSLGDLALSRSAVGIGGQVAQTGIPGRSSPMSVATPGGLLAGSDFGGSGLRFKPHQFSFADHLTWDGKNHHLDFGGEVRLLRNSINQLFGTVYSFDTLANFLADRASVEFVGDLGSFGGAPGARKTTQQYYIAYWQDAWNFRRDMNITYGLRYEYYTPLREERDRAVVLDPATGTLLPPGTPFYRSRKDNFLPRVSFVWAPRCTTLEGDLPKNEKKKLAVVKLGERLLKEPCVINTNPTVISASFGMHVGPDTMDNILRPVTSDRIRLSRDGLAFPTDPGAMVAAFAAGPDDRKLQPLALSRDYISPARVYKFDVSLKRALINRVVTAADQNNDDKHVTQELFVLLSYQRTRSWNLLLHNFANRITGVETNPNPTLPAVVTRQFDFTSGGQLHHPFGEIDYLTTGGRANYDSLQVRLNARARKYLRYFEADYTLARNYGNTDGDSAAGVGDPLDYDYDLGYVAGDVRHKFSFGAVFIMPDCDHFPICHGHEKNPFLRELLTGWNIGVLGNFQTGAPVDVRVNRPDVVYLDAAGNVFATPDVGRRAALNVPGGGSSVAAYRPNLISGVNPYTDGFNGRRFLNPAAFSTPAPGELGNIPRGALRGPGLRIVSLSFRKDINFTREKKMRTLHFNADITNLFNFTNFKLSSAKLPNALGLDATKNQLQPGQPFTAEAAPDFGVLKSTVKGKQDLGSSRQIQFGLSFDF